MRIQGPPQYIVTLSPASNLLKEKEARKEKKMKNWTVYVEGEKQGRCWCLTCLLSVFTQCVIWLILNFAVSGSVFEIAAKLEIHKITFSGWRSFCWSAVCTKWVSKEWHLHYILLNHNSLLCSINRKCIVSIVTVWEGYLCLNESVKAL